MGFDPRMPPPLPDDEARRPGPVYDGKPLLWLWLIAALLLSIGVTVLMEWA
jgi:hypothetical protein